MTAMWPDADELAQVLNVENTTDWQTTLDRVMAAGIAKVKSDCRMWGTTDEDSPTDSQAQAALRMAELMASRPDGSAAPRDPTYLRLLTGQRRGFTLA